MKRNYIWQLLIAIDQLGNTILAGWADETISARAYRTNYKKRWKLMEKIINTLFFFDYEYVTIGTKKIKIKHCQLSYEHEKERGHKPVLYRDE